MGETASAPAPEAQVEGQPEGDVQPAAAAPAGDSTTAPKPQNKWQEKNLVKRAVRSYDWQKGISEEQSSTGTRQIFVDIVGAQQALLEKNRNMEKTLTYKTNYHFLTMTLIQWRTTILPQALKKMDIWCATIFHSILFGIDQFHRERHGRDVGYFERVNVTFASIGQLNWLLVFTLTFFLGQCYTRYLKFYGACTGMGGKLMMATQKLSADFETLPDDRWDVVRFLSAEILLVYMQIYDRPGVSKDVAREVMWKRLMEPESEFLHRDVELVKGKKIACPPLLSAEEVKILKAYNGNKVALLQTWALRAAGVGYEKIGISRAHIPVKDEIFAIGANGSFIGNALALPIPFPYYHALVLLTVVDYFLWGFAFLTINSTISPFLIFMVTVLMSSMRELACALADPFGDDEQDFPINVFITKLRAVIAPVVIETPWYPTAKSEKTEGIKNVAYLKEKDA